MKVPLILPTITTTNRSDWREKCDEISFNKIKEACVFPTTLNIKERKELYGRLEKTSLERIPFVHLRSDMEEWELEYFISHYHTKIFNTHSRKEHPFVHNLSKFTSYIFIENVFTAFDEEEIQECAGVCIDFSHLENDRKKDRERYNYFLKIIKKYPRGCGHLSSVRNVKHIDENAKVFHAKASRYDSHWLGELCELDYIIRYKSILPPIIALELENPIKRQLEAKEYVERRLKGLFHLLKK